MNQPPHPTKNPLSDHPDHAGGTIFQGPAGRNAHPVKGSPPKQSMIDGPYGGKNRQG